MMGIWDGAVVSSTFLVIWLSELDLRERDLMKMKHQKRKGKHFPTYSVSQEYTKMDKDSAWETKLPANIPYVERFRIPQQDANKLGPEQAKAFADNPDY